MASEIQNESKTAIESAEIVAEVATAPETCLICGSVDSDEIEVFSGRCWWCRWCG